MQAAEELLLKENIILVFDADVEYRRLNLHFHNQHEIFLCTGGSGDQFTPKGKEAMRAGDLFFFSAGYEHRSSGAKRENALGLVINFGDEILHGQNSGDDEAIAFISYLKKWTRQKHCRLPLKPEAYPQLKSCFEDMKKESYEGSYGSKMALKSGVLKVLLIMLRNNKFPTGLKDIFTGDQSMVKIKRICEYLKHNYNRQVKIEEVINLFKISRSHFHALFQKHTGMTMTQYLNGLRCCRAAELLRNTDLSLEEICHLSGFGSVCSLYQRMIIDTGHSVSYYRNLK